MIFVDTGAWFAAVVPTDPNHKRAADSNADIERAWKIFEQFSDKDWSFTDCTSKAVMESSGIKSAFAFDKHFSQFGNITVIP